MRRRSTWTERAGIDERMKAVRREHQALRKAGLPSDARLFERLGQLCGEAGMVAESRAWLEQSIKLEPSGERARAELARLSGVSGYAADSHWRILDCLERRAAMPVLSGDATALERATSATSERAPAQFGPASAVRRRCFAGRRRLPVRERVERPTLHRGHDGRGRRALRLRQRRMARHLLCERVCDSLRQPKTRLVPTGCTAIRGTARFAT